MARRKLSMNEYLEMVYQWHRGRSVRQIRDSLRMSRKTIHKYLELLRERGLNRERPLPEEADLAQRVASVVSSASFKQPARERIRLYHPQIESWLKAAAYNPAAGGPPAGRRAPARGQLHEPAPLRPRAHRAAPEAGDRAPGPTGGRAGPGRLWLCRTDEGSGKRQASQSLGLHPDPQLQVATVLCVSSLGRIAAPGWTVIGNGGAGSPTDPRPPTPALCGVPGRATEEPQGAHRE